MKKINNCSAQFKIIQKPMNTNENQFDEKIIEKNNPKNNQKKKLSKQNQEFINKISASGFKQFSPNKWIYQIL